MIKAAPIPALEPASLDSLYALVGEDLKRVDALILARVKNEAPLIEEIARHIVASGGKRIRPALTLASARLCHGGGDRHLRLAAAVEFIHTATLLHDDVVDASRLRRGLATANEVFGNKASVLVGDFLLSQAFQLTVEDGGAEVLRILADASAIIAKGEVLQLSTERNPETSVADYLKVITGKTAALFAAACELGASGSPQQQAMEEFGRNLGIAFQLTDDVLDYAADDEAIGKHAGDDFREGKVTLPVIIAYQAGTAEEKEFWQRTLARAEQQPEDFARARSLIAKHNAPAQSSALAAKYCAKAREALHCFPAGPAKSALLEAVEFALTRGY